jgi:hypothetical protein
VIVRRLELKESLMKSYRACGFLNAILLSVAVIGAAVPIIPMPALAGAFEDQARDLGLDPSTVERFFIDVSTESQVAIAFMTSGTVKVFEYATNRLISETSPTGEVRDLVRRETLKPTGETGVYEVYANGRLVGTTRFGDDGMETTSRTGSEAVPTRRYLKRDRTLHTSRQYVALWYRPSVPRGAAPRE